MTWEPSRLDDQAHLSKGDPGGMLPEVASSAAQVRSAYRTALEAGVSRLTSIGRPRAVVVAGMGVAGIAGDLLAAVCGPGSPAPVITVSSHRLPGWVGAADLVVLVSPEGRTEETLEVAAQAVRRGCGLLAVAPAGSPLEAFARQASGVFVPVAAGGQSRAKLWSLVVPLLMAATELGLAKADQELFESTATTLEDIANRCRPSSDSFINPGKTLALELAESIPMIWGSSPVTAVAAHRLACQLQENAHYPALWGELPEAAQNQLAVIDGPLAQRDIFADTAERALRLVVLRDTEEHPQVAKVRDAAVRMAEDRGVQVTELVAEAGQPLLRLASLIELGDYASAYLALGYGLDPTPVTAVTELKARISL